MFIKKIPPRAALILSFEEHHHVAQFVALLADVDKRVDANERKSVSKRKSSGEKENKVRKFCGPCFLNQIIYHESVNCMRGIFTQRDYHDGSTSSP
jgi:hypothetical protein